VARKREILYLRAEYKSRSKPSKESKPMRISKIQNFDYNTNKGIMCPQFQY